MKNRNPARAVKVDTTGPQVRPAIPSPRPLIREVGRNSEGVRYFARAWETGKEEYWPEWGTQSQGARCITWRRISGGRPCETKAGAEIRAVDYANYIRQKQ